MAAPKAVARFMNGKVMANPEMARGPTILPMKILSIILYSEAAVIATIAGMAYCASNLPMGLVPSSNVAFLLSISVLSDYVWQK